MAAKVNTKFIVILGAALSIAFVAVAWVAYQSIKKSGDDYIALGDKAMAESKYPDAVSFYARAVYKDQRNSGWIAKWIAAMEKTTPTGRAVYNETYQTQYLRALQAAAEADRSDYAANRRWLNERWELVKLGGSVAAMESYLPFVDEMVKAFTGTEAEKKKLLRYRGLTRVALLSKNPDAKSEDLESARKDLEGALDADPGDKDAMVGLTVLDMTMSERAKSRDEKEDMARYHEAAQARVTRFISQFPPASGARVLELNIWGQIAQQTSDKPVTLQDVLQDRQARIEELVAAVLAEKPENLEPAVVDSASTVARLVLPHPRGRDAAREMLAYALASKPDNATFLMLASELDLAAGDTEAALTKLQRVVDMPDKPLSLAGAMLFANREEAIRRQTHVAFRTWEAAPDPAKKQQAAELAKKYRDEFVTRVGETSNPVLAIDARLALINGDVRGAATLLTRYNQQTNETDAESMALQGALMLNQGNVGAAKQSFERVLQRQPGNQRALLALSRISFDAQEYGDAARYARAALKADPDNQSLKEQVAAYEQLAAGKIDDPVIKIIVDAQAQATGVEGDLEKAIATIRAGLAADNGKLAKDFRLHVALVQLLGRKNDKAGAIAAIDEALSKVQAGPITESLVKLKESLSNEDPVKLAIERIDKSNAPEVQKHLERHQVLLQAAQVEDSRGNKAESEKHAKAAQEQLDAAVKLAPEDPQVFEHRFDAALRARDRDALALLARTAEEKNLDKVNGQLYRARLLVTQEKHAEASTELRNVLERDRLNFMAWRLLGLVQMNLNDGEGAVASFRKALEIRLQDPVSLNGLLRALVATNRGAEALELARKSEKWAGNNPEFVEILIGLETNAPGGDRDRALQLRQSIARMRPENKGNTADLAMLQIQQRKWPEAKATIDQLRSDANLKDAVVVLEARWHAAQGQFAEAERVYEQWIETTPKDKLDESPYLAAAALLQSFGQPDRALKFLEKGLPIQRKEYMLIDRQIGDVCFQAQRLPEAVAAYKRVLDAGSKDEGDAVAKRMLECYLTMKEWAKFDELLATLGPRGQQDSTLLVLAAEAASVQGDQARASRLYDQAVAADQRNHIVFLKRGDFSRQDPAKIRDAVADFEQAARLAPGSTIPRLRLADLLLRQDKREEAMEQLDKALEIDPANDALRDEVINLRAAANQQEAVVGLLDGAIKLKPDDAKWLLKGGTIMTLMGRTDQAAKYLAKAWENEKTLRVAIPYATALINKQPPDVVQAARVADAPELKDADPMPRHMLRAMVLVRGANPASADGEVAQALAKCDQDNAGQAELFVAGLNSVYGEPPAQLAAMAKIEARTPVRSWLLFQMSALRLQNAASAAKGAADLESLGETHKDPTLRGAAYSLLAAHHFNAKDYEKTVACYRKALEISPNDVNLMNNCAYIMGEKLKQYSDALVMAQRAADAAPDSAIVLDTLGTVQLGLKNCDAAAGTLQKAVDKAKSDNEKAPSMIHLARAMNCLNRKEEAQRLRTEVRRLFDRTPELEAQYGEDLKVLVSELDGQ